MAAFTWKDYLEIARKLQANQFENLSEASLRSAVSRAYYAAFHHAQDWLKKQPGQHYFSEDAKAHDEVINDLKRCHYTTISDELFYLKRFRRKCDYELEVYNLERIARTAISQSDHIITTLKG